MVERLSHTQLQVGSIPTAGTNFLRKENHMETIIIEVRAAEGGDDAKLLVLDQVRAYVNAAQRRCL